VNLSTVFRGPATIDPPRLVLVTPPAVEPWLVTDDALTQALKLDSDQDQAYVALVLKAARRYFENITGLCLINQTWKLSFDDLPIRQGQFGLEYGLAPSMSRFTGPAAGREIRLYRAPLATVSWVKYLDENGALQTFDPTNYSVGSAGVSTTFGRLWLNEGADWPSVGSYPGAMQIQFVAGFGSAASDVPEEIRMALLFLAAHWYENRLPANPDGAVELPNHLNSLIEMNRLAFTA